MEGIQLNSDSEAVIEGVRERARVFVRDPIVGKTVVVCLPRPK